jgi:hypothetical protein
MVPECSSLALEFINMEDSPLNDDTNLIGNFKVIHVRVIGNDGTLCYETRPVVIVCT